MWAPTEAELVWSAMWSPETPYLLIGVVLVAAGTRRALKRAPEQTGLNATDGVLALVLGLLGAMLSLPFVDGVAAEVGHLLPLAPSVPLAIAGTAFVACTVLGLLARRFSRRLDARGWVRVLAVATLALSLHTVLGIALHEPDIVGAATPTPPRQWLTIQIVASGLWILAVGVSLGHLLAWRPAFASASTPRESPCPRPGG